MSKKFELRKIHYSASLSQETSAYTAQFWVDGVHLCDVSNQGFGGCDEQHAAKGKTYADIEALEAWIKANIPAKDTGMVLDGKPFMMEQNIEAICGDLLTESLVTKDLQRILKRTIAYFDPARKAIYTIKGKVEGVRRAHVITEIMRKQPEAKVLNNLPFADALAIFRANA